MPLKSYMYVSGFVHAYWHSHLMSGTEYTAPLKGSPPVTQSRIWREIIWDHSLWLLISPQRAPHLVNDTNNTSYLKGIASLIPYMAVKSAKLKVSLSDLAFMIFVSSKYLEWKQNVCFFIDPIYDLHLWQQSLLLEDRSSLKQVFSNLVYRDKSHGFKRVVSKFLGKNSRSLLGKGYPRN